MSGIERVIQTIGETVVVGAQHGGGHLATVEPGPTWMALAPFLPLVGVVICLICALVPRLRTSKLPAWGTVASLAVAFGLILATWLSLDGRTLNVHAWEWINLSWGDGPGRALIANFAFHIDSLTVLWMLFVTGLGALIALYAVEYMEHDVGLGYCRFFAGFSLFVFSMSCLVMADNLLLMYLGWEGVGFCSYLLIGYFYKKPSAVAAAKKAFIVNRIGDLGLALGIMLIFVQFGTLEYGELFANERLLHYKDLALAGDFAQIPFNVQLIALLLMVGAFGKSAQFPLYVWLPDAMEGPTPVSALIHAATMVTAGVFLIARMFPIFLVSEHALPTVAWIGTITALLAATIGMAQFDIKRIMAYSTVSQLGYMFAGLGVLTSVGAAFHVFTHAFFKATLFLCCGAVMHGFAGQLDLRKVSGLRSQKGWMIVTLAMLIACLNLSGFPLTGGFFSKDMILAEAFVTPGFRVIGWILLLTAGLTAYYTFRVFFRVFVGPVDYEPGDEHHGEPGSFHPHPPGWAVNLVLAILGVGSLLVAGVYFVGGEHGWVGSMIHDSSAHYQADGTHAGTLFGQDPHTIMYYVSAAIGLAGIAIAWWLHYAGRTEAATCRADRLAFTGSRVARWARDKWYVDEFYDFLFRRPLWLLGQVFYFIDRWFVDGLVNVFGILPRLTGWAVRPSQSGLLHGYALGTIGGTAVLLLIVWLVT
ncbi:MAG: NADH-quinone oxidoreductase subunit L [Planctomycetes bacterium]|nr:NADH-quinone oxidoreductase subunit L [Planctomycetota bacterium]